MESFRKFSIIDEQLRIAKAFADNDAYGKYLMTHFFMVLHFDQWMSL